MNSPVDPKALELPRYSLDVQELQLGANIKAVGMELLETESREPLRGPEAAKIWAAGIPALANREPFVLDFFSHLERVREFCAMHSIVFREAASRCLVVAVDYRLAPEHPFPAAADDAMAAYAWVHRHTGELGIAEGQVGVMGDSAGGNLAVN